MKITIIGANSFIARNFIFFLQQHHPHVSLTLYDVQPTHADTSDLSYHAFNILDKNACQQIDLQCDLVYLFTGKTGTLNGFTEYEPFVQLNEMALLNILHAYLLQKSTAKIIFPSTRLVYKGKHGALTESAEKEFNTPYAITKYACEQFLKMYHKLYDIPYATFRICVPYGTLIPNASSYGTAEFMLTKAKSGQDIPLYGNGEVRRTLTHMYDLSCALLAGGKSARCLNDCYNIGGENYSLAEMAQLIASKYGVKVNFVPWPEQSLKIESGDTVFDASKFEQCTHCFPTGSFADWIEKE